MPHRGQRTTLGRLAGERRQRHHQVPHVSANLLGSCGPSDALASALGPLRAFLYRPSGSEPPPARAVDAAPTTGGVRYSGSPPGLPLQRRRNSNPSFREHSHAQSTHRKALPAIGSEERADPGAHTRPDQAAKNVRTKARPRTHRVLIRRPITPACRSATVQDQVGGAGPQDESDGGAQQAVGAGSPLSRDPARPLAAVILASGGGRRQHSVGWTLEEVTRHGAGSRRRPLCLRQGRVTQGRRFHDGARRQPRRLASKVGSRGSNAEEEPGDRGTSPPGLAHACREWFGPTGISTRQSVQVSPFVFDTSGKKSVQRAIPTFLRAMVTTLRRSRPTTPA